MIPLPVGEPVNVTLLGLKPEEFRGTIAGHDRDRLHLLLDRTLLPGTPVKILWNHSLFLAEVVTSGPEGAVFCAACELQHALYNTDELARLARTLMDEGIR